MLLTYLSTSRRNIAFSQANLRVCLEYHFTFFFHFISVADNYGKLGYAVFLFSLTIWWGMVWGDATACPYFHFESLYEGTMKPLEVAVRTIAEVFGGIAVFK